MLTCPYQEVDEDDMRALDALLPANAGERRTLADIIFSKLDNLEGGNTDADDEKHHGQLAVIPKVCETSRSRRAWQIPTARQTPRQALTQRSSRFTQSTLPPPLLMSALTGVVLAP